MGKHTRWQEMKVFSFVGLWFVQQMILINDACQSVFGQSDGGRPSQTGIAFKSHRWLNWSFKGPRLCESKYRAGNSTFHRDVRAAARQPTAASRFPPAKAPASGWSTRKP